MADIQNVISMKGITKTFPGVVALEDVDFSLRKGEIHALMGENGAGKSTLIKVLTGVEHPDKGTIELEGKLVQVRSPQHSQELGISTVYQEINLCTNISVAENILLGHEPHRFGSIHWKKMNQLAHQAMQRLGIDIDVTRRWAIIQSLSNRWWPFAGHLKFCRPKCSSWMNLLPAWTSTKPTCSLT